MYLAMRRLGRFLLCLLSLSMLTTTLVPFVNLVLLSITTTSSASAPSSACAFASTF